MIPDRIPQLEVSIAARAGAGQLLKSSTYEFRYLQAAPEQPSVALLMPATARLTWTDGDLFAPMDQNLPEGDLFMRIRALFPKQQTTAMHLLAFIGDNGIGRLGYRIPGAVPPSSATPLSKETLLATTYSSDVFNDLVVAYLSTGAGIAGMQPKIMVPEVRMTVPIPTLIVKAASEAYPGLAANEFLCLRAANHAGIETPIFDLSHDGKLLVLERFDAVLNADSSVERLGFEDIAALSGQRVRDTLSDRKYHGSYQRIAELLRQLQLPQSSLDRFFAQVAFSIMVRNGDAHLKNFGLLYRDHRDMWLAPMFDVVTTAIYRYTQYAGGPELEDRTLALKLFAGKHATKAYPTPDELLAFGSKVCNVQTPALVLRRIAQGMQQALDEAKFDERIPRDLLSKMREAWQSGTAYADDASKFLDVPNLASRR
jgi:serine/threonine-protein kinase HipA